MAKRQAEEDDRRFRERLKEMLVEVNTKAFDQASAYTNLVTLAGYAGGFAIWSATRSELTRTINISFALALGFSLAVFVFFEVYKMIDAAYDFHRTRSLIHDAGSSMSSKDFEARRKEFDRVGGIRSMRLQRIWSVVLIPTAAPALFGICLLFYNYLALLIGWPWWPR
jgi:hypothetical protein